MNTWNALPDTYQHRVYKNTLATVNRHIQQAENPTPAVVSSTDAACVDHAILLDYLTSEMPREELEIRCTDPHIPMQVTNSTRAKTSPLRAGDDVPQLNSRGLAWEPAMCMGIRVTMATMWMWMRRKKHRKPRMD
jgi:hypothetical protein